LNIQGRISHILQTVKIILATPDAQSRALHPENTGTIGIIVGRDLVGDALIKLPFLRALRQAFPSAKIHWITSQGPTAYGHALREVTRGLIDYVHETPPWLDCLGRPADPHSTPPFFDLLIDTRNYRKPAIAARQLPHRLFLATAMRYSLSDRHPALDQRFWHRPPHICDRLLQTVELAAGYKPSCTGALPVSDALRQKVRLMLPEGKTYVGFAPGAGNPIKIWPRYKFEKVAAMQVAEGRVPVFILGPQELAAYDALNAAVPTAKFPLQDYEVWQQTTLTIDHTLAIAERLNVAVANDSGVGHMLAAADCPLISLFGPTSPEKLAPRVTHGKVIRAQEFGGAMMKLIPVENVHEAVKAMLASTAL